MENYLFLSSHNSDEAWEIVKRNYQVEHKTATGSDAKRGKTLTKYQRHCKM